MRRLLPLALALLLPSCTPRAPSAAPLSPSPPPRLLFADDFRSAELSQWHVELEKGGTVAARDGVLDIDVPAGCTVWFKPLIEGPVMIEYDATVIARGGPNDRVSDLNCFWMARDARIPDNLFATRRTGRFAEYNQLRGYYVGLGGNGNTTTRFRRYIGDPQVRPLLPEHDLNDPRDLLVPNATQRIRLVARGPQIQYFRDGSKLFELTDPQPYTSGWFGLRTVRSHLHIARFRVYRMSG